MDDANQTLAIVAGLRTPFARVGTDLARASAADLATHVFRELLDRTGFDPARIDEVILGCAGPQAREANVARVAALRAGVPERVPGVTIMRNCASGMESILDAQMRLRAGDGDVFLVGGTESMSSFPLMFGNAATSWFGRLAKARTPLAKIRAFTAFRPSFLKPRVAIVEGLTDPITGLMMGNTAENVARRFGIDRNAQDEFALRSHQRAAAAIADGRLADEIAPFAAPPKFAATLTEDNGVRKEQSAEALAKLRPVFDKREGDVTVGNACQVTDGAAALLVMSLARARAEGLEPLAVVRSQSRAGLDPAVMGLGPVHAAPIALERAGLGLGDVDLVEINEAFAAQVLGCVEAFASATYCREQLGRDVVGTLDADRLNVNGGAIALGHPIAASGTRLVLTLAHEMKRRGSQFGLATLCVGGGQGQAVVLEAA